MTLLPQIELQLAKPLRLSPEYFGQATDGQPTPERTEVTLTYEAEYLHVAFVCHDNPFGTQNTYTEHNTDLWNQEVFEVFVAAGSSTPFRYLEIELNPNNALFVGWIDNPTLEAPQALEFVPYEQAGIRHTAQQGTDQWAGSLQIPWKLIGEREAVYRLNFYRITSLVSHLGHHWEGTPDDCRYACWSPTLSGQTPRFHRPERFGVLHLAD